MKKWMVFLIIVILFGCARNDTQETQEEREEFSQDMTFTILESEYSESPQPEGTLTLEEATKIAAYYIWDVLGINLDNAYVQLTYAPMETHTRTYWSGVFADSEEELESGVSFYFSIDAITGERIDLVSTDGIERFWEDFSYHPKMEPEEMETLLNIAENYAKRYFNLSDVIDIQFKGEEPSGLVVFVAVDETGREADIFIQKQTQQLYSIETLINDLDPNLEGPVG